MNEKFYSFLIVIIRLTLIVSIIGALYFQNWNTLFITILTLILTLIPNIVKERYNINFPIGFHFTIIFLIYAAIFLGEVTNFYDKFWWWDIAMHAISAISLGLIVFMFLLFLYQGKKLKAKPITISILTFSIALSLGALWEIFEFLMDSIFGTNMLKSGLLDTMGDLIVGSIGALTASFAGYLYLKQKEFPILKKFIDYVIDKNPHLFKRKKRRNHRRNIQKPL